MGVGRWEMGDGSREMGGWEIGRWEMGVGRWETEMRDRHFNPGLSSDQVESSIAVQSALGAALAAHRLEAVNAINPLTCSDPEPGDPAVHSVRGTGPLQVWCSRPQLMRTYIRFRQNQVVERYRNSHGSSDTEGGRRLLEYRFSRSVQRKIARSD